MNLKPATSKPKPAAAPEAGNPDARKPGTTQMESSIKNINVEATDFAALLKK